MAQSEAQLANLDQTTHGMSRTRTFAIWQAMLNRCYNPRYKRFKNHGGRGITVCRRWRNSFTAFYEDMGAQRKGLTLERKNNNGNYTPSNCVWATWNQQARNRRNTVRLRMNGITKAMADWADEYGVKRTTIRARIYTFGWSVKSAITLPVIGRGRRPNGTGH